MYQYKMIFINRLREYKKLLKNMLLELLVLIAFSGILLYSIFIYYIPILNQMDQVNNKMLLFDEICTSNH